MSSKQPAADVSRTEEPTVALDREEESVKECPKCPSYKAKIVNIENELKNKEKIIERLKEEMNKLREQLTKLKKVIWKSDHFFFNISTAVHIFSYTCEKTLSG